MTLKKKPPVGYIPAGSTNDFGASIGLPKNVMRAAEIVMKGEWNPYDVGQLETDILYMSQHLVHFPMCLI